MVPLSFSGEKHVAILLELELNARALSEQRQAGTSVPALLLHAVQLLELQSKQAGLAGTGFLLRSTGGTSGNNLWPASCRGGGVEISSVGDVPVSGWLVFA